MSGMDELHDAGVAMRAGLRYTSFENRTLELTQCCTGFEKEGGLLRDKEMFLG
jgi:hypothetical protein